jgi:hypothetical protein
MRTLLAFAQLAIATSVFAAQPAGPPAMTPAPMTSPMAQPVTLTRADVENLLELMPLVGKESARMSGSPMAPPGQMSPAQQQEMHKIEALLGKKGMSLVEFATKVGALVATYMVLDPQAFEEQMPREDSPEVARVLSDPSVPEEQKTAIRAQIKMAQENKEAIRAQMTSMASEENKKVVRPFLAKVKATLAAVRAEARKAMAGPRR